MNSSISKLLVANIILGLFAAICNSGELSSRVANIDYSQPEESIRDQLSKLLPLGVEFHEVNEVIQAAGAISSNVVRDAITIHPRSKEMQPIELAIFVLMKSTPSAPNTPVMNDVKFFLNFKDKKLTEVFVWKTVSGI